MGFLTDLWHTVRPLLLVLLAVVVYRILTGDQTAARSADTPQRIPGDVFVHEKEKVISVQAEEVGGASVEEISPVGKERKLKRAGPKRIVRRAKPIDGGVKEVNLDKIFVFYSTLTGTSGRAAKKICEDLSAKYSDVTDISLVNLDYVDDLDDYFVNPKSKGLYIMVVPSYETESPLDFFIETLKETYNDFRIDSLNLNGISFGVFGIGDSQGWPNRFCNEAQMIDKYLKKLGATRLLKLETGCMRSDLQERLDGFIVSLESILANKSNANEFQRIANDNANEVDSDSEENDSGNGGDDVMDIEDLGVSVAEKNAVVKQMVAKDSPTHKSLTKQGYTIVGSHSGVKICRWTKSALRGRGSCYKFAFYGIKSHLCMETTPSLSCSNKCVFCWRHGTNPVGTTWRWEVDPPDLILKGALEGHYQKIKQMRGIPGVVESRFEEAFRVRHCALSLVGEPIFYPHINEFVGMLHDREISSFLVCNAQHPNELKALNRVTQLYVSIDASNKDSLKKVDRPLHRDFWDRTLTCLDILRTSQKMQRTVFRLTLVKGFNVDEVKGYADLVQRGVPCFVEVKGVTYCGSNTPLTMQNVPFYDEVVAFVEQLNEELAAKGLEYGIAAQHAHSCCILIAQKRFFFNDRWHTGIDYPKFFSLLQSGEEFGPLDYVTATPEWAVWGANEGGFSPEDERWSRKKKEKA